MAYFQSKNPDLSKFWRVLERKILVNYIGLHILRLFDIYFCNLVHFRVIWYIFPRVGMLYQEKSGNPWFHVRVSPHTLTRYHLLPKTLKCKGWRLMLSVFLSYFNRIKGCMLQGSMLWSGSCRILQLFSNFRADQFFYYFESKSPFFDNYVCKIVTMVTVT
jgi:hypothetical protein